MSVKYEVLAATGTYTDKNGQEKTRWTKHGVVMEKKSGGLALKLESMPVGEFNGWFTLAEPKPRDQQTGKKASGLADMDEDVPF